LNILVEAWRQCPTSTLHAAIFMKALRLYIHVALVNKQPLSQATPSCCLTSSIRTNIEDLRVINARITVLVARVLDYCYDQKTKPLEKWQELSDDLISWKFYMPASFHPMLGTDDDAYKPFGR
jgi:hypothetical protein